MAVGPDLNDDRQRALPRQHAAHKGVCRKKVSPHVRETVFAYLKLGKGWGCVHHWYLFGTTDGSADSLDFKAFQLPTIFQNAATSPLGTARR